MDQAINIDIGTSGIRAQLLNLTDSSVLRTAILSRNPLPGANVFDHMDFAINYGQGIAHEILVSAVNSLINNLKPENLKRVAICGNPIQLSIFEGIEIRDLAFAGKNALEKLHLKPPERDGHIVPGSEIGLCKDIDVIIPPSVRHEIGADALAMMIKSGFLDTPETCMVTDYGTNAEMALKVGDRIYTGSAAAGPVIEGQQISKGMLATPGAIADLRLSGGWQALVLDGELRLVEGPRINLRNGTFKTTGYPAKGITGTGVISLMYAGLVTGIIKPPRIEGSKILLGKEIAFTEEDVIEAGKAFGALRAGHLTLMHEAGIEYEDLETMYMCGASGTYVDPLKARFTGIVPATPKKIVQCGNTSLELAKDLAFDPDYLSYLNEIKTSILANHIMFASSPIFAAIYVQEIALWNEGMPLEKYNANLERSGIQPIPQKLQESIIERRCERDILEPGESLEIMECRWNFFATIQCSGCDACVKGCPEEALSREYESFKINTEKCLGTACRRCEERCPEEKFSISNFKLERPEYAEME
ncbi:methylamine methyltransferase corrinoid protein reductive activase [Methanosarcina sp. MSH10X1]|uniref:methylamine methyltransferase corrinoid protein reductive activase n=1 Tax=Methanosarcina sp. MSH10X1 TaxID=2507075 RepID=UPI000FFB5A8D|nr:methylamine methyltransferase corrinoid protein reductive activase [Methanosarcina sp. MSH10X1]RXA19463.1 methylamine methyltransferase corrinoid protein reductive activase [Methanosarcina sp. MSH10X1]